MRSAHDARGTVDRRSKEVAAPALVGARVQSATHLEPDAPRTIRGGHLLLQLKHRDQGVKRAVEGRMYTIACHLHDRAAIAEHGRAGYRVVPRQRRSHPLGFRLPQPGAALDVGEEVGDWGRRLGHASTYGSAVSRRPSNPGVTEWKRRHTSRPRLSRKTAGALLAPTPPARVNGACRAAECLLD